jgi:hypothetical protein
LGIFSRIPEARHGGSCTAGIIASLARPLACRLPLPSDARTANALTLALVIVGK